jgi:DNA-binding NarL/FixJ family response regulator
MTDPAAPATPTAPTGPLRVLVADDQALVRAGFRMILDAQPDIAVVAEAGNGREAVEAATRLQPDVILMDIRMPEMDGLEATRRLAGADARTPLRVLVLTTFDLDDYVYEALQAGASGFLLKDVGRDELVHAVRVVAAGDALLAPSVTRRLVAEFARQRPRSPTAPSELEALTSRERDVLELVARGLSNAEIAEALVVGEATVKSHVAHILMKLHLRDRIQAVILAYEVGLVRPRS